MNKFILFYSVWAFVCIICLILVEESSSYLSKEWKIKDIIRAIVLFPITIEKQEKQKMYNRILFKESDEILEIIRSDGDE